MEKENLLENISKHILFGVYGNLNVDLLKYKSQIQKELGLSDEKFEVFSKSANSTCKMAYSLKNKLSEFKKIQSCSKSSKEDIERLNRIAGYNIMPTIKTIENLKQASAEYHEKLDHLSSSIERLGLPTPKKQVQKLKEKTEIGLINLENLEKLL